MSEIATQETSNKPLLDRMVADRQLSLSDAAILRREKNGATAISEEQVLRWLAREYDLEFNTLEDIEPDRELLSLFPARVLLKEELLPIKRVEGAIEVATSRLFATQGLDTLRALTGQKIKPVLAPSEAIQRETKKRLGVGADTIDTLKEETPFQVVDENGDEDNNLDKAGEDDASIIRFVNQVICFFGRFFNVFERCRLEQPNFFLF